MDVVDIGLTVKKNEDFSEWYQQIVLKSELTDYSEAKGFVVLRPYGFSIWDQIKQFFDKRIKALGHSDAYFPTLIPENLLKKEAEHFSGFTPEVFWITHAGNRKLDEKLAVRPTSETIVYSSYSKWIHSWRDLPLLLNLWNAVLRAEIKSTKPFIRTSEFLWQEGHTVHETKEEADLEVETIFEIYRVLIEKYLAIPVLAGKKTEKEKFVGALYTLTLESLMPDGKALQMGTSHNLGQNFSKSFNIKFLDKNENEKFAWQTSWGISWRLIGALIMVHGDDKGLILPPKIAPIQVVLIPIYYNDKDKINIDKKISEVSNSLSKIQISNYVDNRDDHTPGWKFNHWELKGIPLRIEIGPKDLSNSELTIVRRDNYEKTRIKEHEYKNIKLILRDIQSNLYNRARANLKNNITDVTDYKKFVKIIEDKKGFIRTCWCYNENCEQKIKEETGSDIRLIPMKKEKIFSDCIYCNKPAKAVVYFSKAY